MTISKPRPGVKIATYTVPTYLPNAPRGVLLVPASQWTVPHKIINKMDAEKVKRLVPYEAYSNLLQVFDVLNTTNSTLVSDQREEINPRKMELQHNINNLFTRSVNTAVNITEGALSPVEQSALEVLCL